MPNLNKTREYLVNAFEAGWGVTTPIAMENHAFDDSDVEKYVGLFLINYTSSNVNIGSAMNKRKRHNGVLQIKIYVKPDTGIKAAYEYADLIATFMDNINLSNLLTNSSETRRGGKTDSGFYTLIVDVPYLSDE